MNRPVPFRRRREGESVKGRRPSPGPPGGDRRGGSGGRQGYTFVELMVVILIIGLAAAAVVLAVPEPGGSLRAEAERFAARAKAARDAAIVESRPVAVEIGPEGYAIERRVGGAWRESARYAWAQGTSAEAAGATEGRSRFDPTGMADPIELTLRRGDRHAAVAIQADGSVHVRR